MSDIVKPPEPTVDTLREKAAAAKANDGVVDDKEFTELKLLRSKLLSKAKSDEERAEINGVMIDVLSPKQYLALLKNDTLKWMTTIIVIMFFALLTMVQNFIK